MFFFLFFFFFRASDNLSFSRQELSLASQGQAENGGGLELIAWGGRVTGHRTIFTV